MVVIEITPKFKLGSLFDGIAGFPLAGIDWFTPVWASETELFPIKVSQKHFPEMEHLGDITQINGAEIELVDVVTFGSPCQDLSVAGKRAGLKGERSGLFMEAVRVIREMREATSGEYPKFILWENVPGAFSSNGGLDFKAVLEEITETKIPMPKSGKWARAGLVRGNGYSVAWRVLDAQYWGVPQRRRRIFLVCDFTGQRAPEILFERQGVSGHFAESRKAREEVAAGIGDGIDAASYWDGGQISDTLDCSMLGKQQAMPEKRRFAAVLTPILADQGGCRMSVSYGKPPTLRAQEHGHQPLVCSVDCRNLYENKELSGTLQCKQTGGYSLNYQNPVRVGYAVRRLTPVECLRLQGFPDNWFDDIPGASDTAMYKACGNSLAVPCARFVLGRIYLALKGELCP